MKIPRASGAALYWFSQRLRGRSRVRERLAFLEHTQQLSSAHVRDLQNEKLRGVVRHAFRTVPYYRRVLQERGLVPSRFAGVDDLVRVPFLTREIL